MADEKPSVWSVIALVVTGPILLVFGVGIVVLGILGGIAYHSWIPDPGPYPRVALVVFGLFLLGLHFWKSGRSAETTNAFDPQVLKIKIQAPREGEQVPRRLSVSGTLTGPIPKGFELRLLRGYPTGGFVPNGRPCTIANDGKSWRLDEFDVAGALGQTRYIEAWLVGPDGTALLENWLANHKIVRILNDAVAVNGRAIEKWLDPITAHTKDMHRYSTVHVVRR